MKQKATVIFLLLLLLILQAGCGAEDTVYLEREETGGRELPQGSAERPVDSASGGTPEEGVTELSGESLDAAYTGGEACYVYVCGAVSVPGVYALPAGSRVYEAVQMAGGLTENAGLTSVNQAEMVQDGQMVYIPTAEEMPHIMGGSAGQMEESEADGKVNLNTASLDELMTLSGIGQAKARDILAYRQKHGDFSNVEEITKVAGIKEGLYDRIKDDIKVK